VLQRHETYYVCRGGVCGSSLAALAIVAVALTDWLRGLPGNSRFAPKYTAPEAPRPTALPQAQRSGDVMLISQHRSCGTACQCLVQLALALAVKLFSHMLHATSAGEKKSGCSILLFQACWLNCGLVHSKDFEPREHAGAHPTL
jgi:hypothetical protein